MSLKPSAPFRAATASRGKAAIDDTSVVVKRREASSSSTTTRDVFLLPPTVGIVLQVISLSASWQNNGYIVHYDDACRLL
jgi:hypothetical protein